MKLTKLFTLLGVFGLFLIGCSETNPPNPKVSETTSPQPSPDPVQNSDQGQSEPEPTESKNPEPTKSSQEVEEEEQKEYYISTTKPSIDAAMEEYDLVWSSLWTATFKAIGEGTMDIFEGYKKLDAAEKRYDKLYQEMNFPTDQLDKELNSKLGSARVDLEDAVAFRIEAIKKAKKMLDSGDITPSVLSEIEEVISGADGYMIKALVQIVEVENRFGIVRDIE